MVLSCSPSFLCLSSAPANPISDTTATFEVSRLEVEAEVFESRQQGAVLADGLNCVAATLITVAPMTTFAQNDGVIALARSANRKAGYYYWYVD